MADQILQPTANTTPDQGGTGAVSGAVNTGHGGTTCSASALSIGGVPDTDSDAKSARWSTFAAASQIPSRLTLKFTWSASGGVDVDILSVGAGSASISFTVEYTINGGGGWNAEVFESVSIFTEGSDILDASGSAEITLPPTTPINQIQVRDLLTADADASSSDEVTAIAGITASISGIQLEVEFGSNKIILGMM